jgi:D-amino-acid oxidase
MLGKSADAHLSHAAASTGPRHRSNLTAMRIVVIGAGVSGLSSALRLAEAGHAVEIWARDRPPRTTSAVAAAIWYPYRAQPADRVLAWAGVTLREFLRLSPDPAAGIVMRDGLELFRDRVDDPPWAAVVPGFRRPVTHELPAGYVDGYAMRLPVIDMSVYLGWLQQRVFASGIIFTDRTIESLDEIRGGADLAVNCTGLGARDLCHDDELFGVRGQIMVVESPEVSEFRLDDATITYIIQRLHDVVLGGTAEEHVYDTGVDAASAASIREHCARLMPALSTAPVRTHKVGIRPCRTAVRLEMERLNGLSIVHNYGHGGAGVTLSWGCADEVVSLCGRRTQAG